MKFGDSLIIQKVWGRIKFFKFITKKILKIIENFLNSETSIKI